MSKYITTASITSDKLRSVRKNLGVTQKEFAELVGVSKPTIERWETSDNEITGPIVLLSRLLDKSVLEDLVIPERDLPLRLWYMYKDDVCTLIDVDETERIVKIKNYTNKTQFRAFGINTNPNFEEYEEFIKSRCFPESRDKIKLILKDLNLPFYDPFLIVERTEGRMAEDDFWIRIER